MRRDLILLSYAARASAPKDLAREVDGRRLLQERRFDHQLGVPRGSLIINYGCAGNPRGWEVPPDAHWINSTNAVLQATSKVRSFQAFDRENVAHPMWAVRPETAHGWLREGIRVLARQDHQFQGRGITILEPTRDHVPMVPAADFYTAYFHKTHEFRVHVFNGQIIDFVQKKRRNEDENTGRTTAERVIRSHDNGWIFAHGALSVNEVQKDRLGELAIRACRALGLDFGAVDILARFGEGGNQAVVAEVNTAPAIENTATLEAYANAITRVYNLRVPARVGR